MTDDMILRAIDIIARIMVACYIPYMKVDGWQGEERCRLILEVFTGHKFEKTRELPWLANPVTGKRLEIDAYNDELKLGLERNGEQHYHVDGHFTKTKEKLEYDVFRDRVKEKLCYKHGVNLIIVPYTVPPHRLASYIMEKLEYLEEIGHQ